MTGEEKEIEVADLGEKGGCAMAMFNKTESIENFARASM